MDDENDSQEEITVEVTVPEPEAEEAPDTTVVVVEDSPAPAPATGDAVLTALLSIESRLAALELQQAGATEIAIEADAKADLALEMDGVVVDEVASVREEVAEALAEEQAPADDDVEPVKVHWLHR